MINLFQPELGAEELEAVRKVFESNWVGKGTVTDQFELGFANHVVVEPELVQSVSCCTEGLFQSMALLDIGPGDEVILPTINFVGAANAVASCGAKPIFCDVDSRTLNATARLMEEKITSRTKAVLILHYAGVPCLMEEIVALTENKNIGLIEDSACSVASSYNGRACGTFGDIGVWSFDAMKVLVTGDGGMVYVRNPEMGRRLKRSLFLGLLSESGYTNKADERWWEYEISCHGRRAIMNDISSAIGIEQLKKLPDFIARRRQVHEYFDTALSDLDWLELPPALPANQESSYYFYPLRTAPGVRDRLSNYLREKDIYTTFRYHPLHCVKHYGVATKLPNAEAAAKTVLCLPIHQSLSLTELETIVTCISDFGKGL